MQSQQSSFSTITSWIGWRPDVEGGPPINDFGGDGEDLQANKGGDWCCCTVVHQSLLFHVSGFIFPILCGSQDWRNLLVPWKVIPWTKSFRYFDGNMANLHVTLILTFTLYLLINVNPPSRLKPFDFIVLTALFWRNLIIRINVS